MFGDKCLGTYGWSDAQMLFSKSIVAANIILGGAIVAAVGSALLVYAINDPRCMERIKRCSDQMGCRLGKCSKQSSDPHEASSV